MTSKVEVDAHAGWPIKVTAIDSQTGGEPTERELGVVKPGEKVVYHCHSTRKLLIEELPRE